MSEELKLLLNRLSNDKYLLNSVEQATRQGAILPVLAHLGWDCYNLQEVVPEFPIGNNRVDYCLRVNQKNVAFIEVKRPSEELERHEKQLLDYSFQAGVEVAILTNGLVWWFYLPLLAGNWQQRKFFSIDIRQQNADTASAHFIDFLSRTSLSGGAALRKARSVKESREKDRVIKESMPTAWKQLLQGPDEKLIELLGDRVESICGYNPEAESSANFILSLDIATASPIAPSSSTTTPRKQHEISSYAESTVSRPTRQKGAVVKIDDLTINAKTVGDLYFQVLKYLCDKGIIDKSNRLIPYATSNVRYLIAKEPIHQRGNKFRIPIEYNGYFMEAHKNYDSAISQLKDFSKECGFRFEQK